MANQPVVVEISALHHLHLYESTCNEAINCGDNVSSEELVDFKLRALRMFDDPLENREVALRLCRRLSEAYALLTGVVVVETVHRRLVSELVEDRVCIAAAGVSDMLKDFFSSDTVLERTIISPVIRAI